MTEKELEERFSGLEEEIVALKNKHTLTNDRITESFYFLNQLESKCECCR
tara:strand:+ start:1530 stop:1679 length:150 start_codon:yes stop_codon:yes gene_type:complete